jgi:succinate-semialdehyde dehydrogenase/glutarate-semialdehyde dehydrogenase
MSTITPSQEQSVLAWVPKQLFIGGEWRDGAEGTLEVEDPATGEPLCEIADAAPRDAMAALDAAVSAGPAFAAMAPRDRGEILRRAFEMVIARKDELALLMTLEMGKPVTESLGEIT